MDHHTLLYCFAGVLICLASVSAAADVRLELSGLPPVTLSFETDPRSSDFRLETSSDTSAKYVSDDAVLDVRVEKEQGGKMVRLALRPKSGDKLSVISYSARIELPLQGLHSVMVPNTRIIAHKLTYYHQHRKWPEDQKLYRCLIPEGFEEGARVNNEAPLILLTDNKGNNAFCVGWAKTGVSSKLTGEAKDGGYQLTLERREDVPLSVPVLEDALFINDSSKPWMDVETGYAKAFDAYSGLRHDKIPEWTTDPVFCTWYCWSENIDQEMMLKVSEKCKQAGIDTVLIDAGWDAKAGENWGDLDRCAIGDYVASKELFPDLPGLVKTMHDMGLKVELWSSGFWYAKGSKTYQDKVKDWMIWTKEGEDHLICPKHPGTRDLLRSQFAQMAKEFDMDGMWIDVSDGVPGECEAKHQHIDRPMGEAWLDCMAAMREGMRSVNPEAIIEARVLHANLNSKHVMDVIQCSDAPHSYEMIRLASIHMRAWAYDIVVKNDPMIWYPTDDATTIGKYLATMVCVGVPCLSVDLLTAPEWQLKQIRVWMDFYNQHKKTLLKGRFVLFGEDYGIPDMLLAGDGEAIVYLKNEKTDKVELPREVKRVYLLNCTDSDKVSISVAPAQGKWQLKAFKPDWSETGVPLDLTSNGELTVSTYVPQGGAAVLEAR